MLGCFVHVYFCDILIFSNLKTRKEHLMHVQMVLETPHHQQLFPKASTCQFIRSSPAGDFLGQWHIISERGVAVDPRKITVVADWATQTPCTDASRGKYVQLPWVGLHWFAWVGCVKIKPIANQFAFYPAGLHPHQLLTYPNQSSLYPNQS
jgi:hypothetical protein